MVSTMKLGVACVFVLLPALAQGPPHAGGQQRPTFSTTTTVLTLDVTALDRDGKPVAGLTPEDFEVKINGSVQPVQTLAYIEAKVDAPSTAPPVEPVVTGLSPRRSVVNAVLPSQSRVFVIVVDDLSFQAGTGKALFVSAEAFVSRLPASDFVGFALTSGSGSINPTRDRRAVLGALKRAVGTFSNPADFNDAPMVGIGEAFDVEDGRDSKAKDIILRECFDPIAAQSYSSRSLTSLRSDVCGSRVMSRAKQIVQQVRANRDRQLQALESIMASLSGAPGIKYVVLLSGGVPVTKDVDQLMPVARAAARAGVQIATMVQEGDIDLADLASSVEGPGGTSSAPSAGRAQSRRDDDRVLLRGAQTLTDMAGGQFYRVIGQPFRFFDRVTASASSVYRLGVALPRSTKPGQNLAISASVKRPGVSALASHYAAAPEPELTLSPAERMGAAVKQGETLYGVPISFGAIVRRGGTPGQVEIGTVITVPGSVDGPLEATFGVLDGTGALKSGKRTVPTVANSDYAITFAVPVQPGPYQLRVAVKDARGNVGAVSLAINASLNVMGDIQASDLLIWSPDQGERRSLLVVEDLPAELKSLTSMVELYAATSLPPDLAVRFALLDVNGKIVQERPARLAPGAGIVRADAQFGVDSLSPGHYALRADVSVGGRPIGSVTTPINKR
jgi:VWFA-related protein